MHTLTEYSLPFHVSRISNNALYCPFTRLFLLDFWIYFCVCAGDEGGGMLYADEGEDQVFVVYVLL